MTKRADITILLIGSGAVYRGDFSLRGQPTLVRYSSHEIAAGVSLSDAVGTLTDDDRPRIGKTAVVLSSNIWNQLITLPRLSIASAEPDEIDAALKYEAETFVGIDPDQAAIGAVELDLNELDQHYWINLVEQTALNDVHQKLVGMGAKEVLLGHPVGTALRPASDDQRERVEIWGNQAARFSADGRLAQIVQGPFESERWLSEMGIAPENGSAAPDLILDPDAEIQSDLSPFADVQDLFEEPAIKAWMANVVGAAKSDSVATQLPWVKHEKPKRSTRTGSLVAVALLAAVATFGYWHASWIRQQSIAITTQTEEIRRPQQLKSSADAELATLLGKRAGLEKEANQVKSELRKAQFLFHQQTNRIPVLLDFLLECRTDDMVIREISHDEKGTVISGISLNGDSAPLLANRLRDLVLPLGWQVHPAAQIGDMKMTSGGPWEFTILLEDVGPEKAMAVDAQTTVQNAAPSIAHEPRWQGGSR